MKNRYEWTDDLKSGIPEIDSQHKEILARAKALETAHNDGRGAEELSIMLGFLESYVSSHFGHEESLMLEHRYPSELTEEHRLQHRGLREVLRDLQGRIARDGVTGAVVDETIRTISEWLDLHLRKCDVQLIDFIRAG